jgi:hypothetical protein
MLARFISAVPAHGSHRRRLSSNISAIFITIFINIFINIGLRVRFQRLASWAGLLAGLLAGLASRMGLASRLGLAFIWAWLRSYLLFPLPFLPPLSTLPHFF